jgi:hypothetical protein
MNDCLYCAPDPVKASQKGINFCDIACRLRFDKREHI